jgi:hypothetical protein
MFGLGSLVLSHNQVYLAPSTWNNIDHYTAALNCDMFCLSATVDEIKECILPKIANEIHKTLIHKALPDVPGLPFLVSRDAKYIQRIQFFPWQEILKDCVVKYPFVELPKTKIDRLEQLEYVSIPYRKTRSGHYR